MLPENAEQATALAVLVWFYAVVGWEIWRTVRKPADTSS